MFENATSAERKIFAFRVKQMSDARFQMPAKIASRSTHYVIKSICFLTYFLVDLLPCQPVF